MMEVGTQERRAARDALREWAVARGVDDEDPAKIIGHVVMEVVSKLEAAGLGPVTTLTAGRAAFDSASWDDRPRPTTQAVACVEAVRSALRAAELPGEMVVRVLSKPQRFSPNEKQSRMKIERSIYVTAVVVEMVTAGLGKRVIVVPCEALAPEVAAHPLFAGASKQSRSASEIAEAG